MKVLLLSTYENGGGAAVAASRLLQALRQNGVDASMLCRTNIEYGPKRLRKQSWASIRERIETNEGVPESLKGLPMALITAGLMSIAFMGFNGIIK